MFFLLKKNGYCMGKWKILDIIDDGENSKTRALLEC